MRNDIRGFDELNESVPRFVSAAKVNDLRFAVWNHIYFLHEVIAERFYNFGTPNRSGAATGRVDDSMKTPSHYSMTRVYSSRASHPAEVESLETEQ